MTMGSGNNKALFALVVISILWGTTYLASRIGAQQMPGLFLAAMRQITAGSILLGYFLLKGSPIPDGQTFKKILLQGIFMLCLGNGLSTWSVQYISSGLAAIIAALIPLLMAFFSILLLRNATLTKMMIVGLLIGLAGILAIFYEYLDDFLNPKFAFGILLDLAAIICWAFGSVYTARSNLKINAFYAVSWQMFLSGLIMVPISYLLGQGINPLEISSSALLALAYLVIFGSIISYGAYVYVIYNLPPSRASLYAYINPIIAVFLGWLILHEKLNTNVGMGTAITLIGVFMVNNEFKKQIKSNGNH